VDNAGNSVSNTTLSQNVGMQRALLYDPPLYTAPAAFQVDGSPALGLGYHEEKKTMSNSIDLYDSIDLQSSVAVYVQIENVVRFAIASGKLEAGDQLPSSRALAERLGVNFNTIAKAFRDLEVMGLIYSRRGMGTFVEKDARKKCEERVRIEIAGRLHEIASEAKAAGMSATAINAIVKACLASDVKPYGPPSKEVLALLKK
jgi:GntR family transcriptional regulator